MIAGHLQEKKGLYYMVLSYKDKSGKRISKWLPTGLPVKGNKKRAEDMLMAARAEFVAGEAAVDHDMPFSSYLVQWMEIARSTLKPNTAAGYASMIQNPIAPYFQQRGITLGGLQAVDIQMFYTSQLKRVSANTVIHYHAIIHRALKYAVKTDLIDVNPADKVERPRKDRFTASFYDGNEVNRLFQAARGTPLELPVMLAAFYGLRRSEVVGLKWDAIDFENKTIAIRHTVTVCAEKGRHRSGGRYDQDGLQPADPPVGAGFSNEAGRVKGAAGEEPHTVRPLLLHGLPGLRSGGCNGKPPEAELHQHGLSRTAQAQRASAHPLPRPASQLRQPAAEKRRPHEADSGVAGAQRLQHDRQHLRPPGRRVQAHLCTGNGKGIGDELRSPYRIRVSGHGGRALERNAEANEKRLSPLWGKALWRRRWDSNPRTGY